MVPPLKAKVLFVCHYSRLRFCSSCQRDLGSDKAKALVEMLKRLEEPS